MEDNDASASVNDVSVNGTNDNCPPKKQKLTRSAVHDKFVWVKDLFNPR